MKKLLSILGSVSLVAASGSYVVSCNPDKDTIKILFIPSNNSTEIINTVKPLEGKLEAELKSIAEAGGRTSTKKVSITTSTSYEVAGQTLKDGKADLAFLPINTYAKFRGTGTDGVFADEGVLLSASRDGATPETTGFAAYQNEDGAFDSAKAMGTKMDAQIAFDLANNYNKMVTDAGDKMNNKVDATAVLQDANNPASYYRSYIYANRAYLEKNNFDLASYSTATEYATAVKTLISKGLENKDYGFSFSGSKTSSAGTLYPILWLKNVIGFSDTELNTIWNNQKATQPSYPSGATNITTGAQNFAIGFSDIRNELTDDDAVKSAYEKTTIIGATDAIPNDLIVYSKKVVSDATYKNDLREAFKNLIAKEENTAIFDIYSHKGYVGPTTAADSDSWELASDAGITTATTETQALLDLMENWS